MVTFSEAINKFWSGAFNFKGRSTRAEYWWAILFIFIANLILFIFDGLVVKPAIGFELLGILFQLFILVPSMALGFRRLHDVGMSGSLYVLNLVSSFIMGFFSGLMPYAYQSPIVVGLFIISIFSTLALSIVLIVFACKPSQAGTNKYGESPFDNEIVYLKQRYISEPPVTQPIVPEVKEAKLNDKIDNIKQLNKLYKDGIITEEEFNELKKRELGL